MGSSAIKSRIEGWLEIYYRSLQIFPLSIGRKLWTRTGESA
jgi:hypothetical protein